jgi:hypothetical protein
MRTEEIEIGAAALDQKSWYRLGSIAAVVIGIGYLIIVPLYAHVGAPSIGGEAWFTYLPGKTTAWWAILGLSVFTDFLFIPCVSSLPIAEENQQKCDADGDSVHWAICRLRFGSHLVALCLDPPPLR